VISYDSRTILFVLGVHRSGTSALCAALAASGVSFGSQLIDAMAGVNDEGFWEDAGVVAVNERLLARTDSSWYAPAPDIAQTDWADPRFDSARAEARGLLQAGFGDAALQAVKDPRLCLTLPFWLALCDELGVATSVCLISRAPLEVARSLEKRDGFPLGYGLRLYTRYRASIERVAPADILHVAYDDLVRDTPAVMAGLAAVLPLDTASAALAGAVRGDLRHHETGDEGDPLALADTGKVELATLEKEIENRYPIEATLREFSTRFTARGLELAEIGEAHTAALATLDERDADIEALSAEHRKALATIEERDEQIREFDQRLAKLGEEHSYALTIVRERDAQLAETLEQLHQREAELAWIKQRLETVSKIPGMGYLIQRLRKNAQG
jgi:hypothetical protein